LTGAAASGYTAPEASRGAQPEHNTLVRRHSKQMTRQPAAPVAEDAPLPNDLIQRLQAHGVSALGEVELRRQLEQHAPSYTLLRLNPIAARKWKARYRILLAASYLDCQSVAEAYARALLASLDEQGEASEAPTTDA
jgi:hypothetical protein